MVNIRPTGGGGLSGAEIDESMEMDRQVIEQLKRQQRSARQSSGDDIEESLDAASDTTGSTSGGKTFQQSVEGGIEQFKRNELAERQFQTSRRGAAPLARQRALEQFGDIPVFFPEETPFVGGRRIESVLGEHSERFQKAAAVQGDIQQTVLEEATGIKLTGRPKRAANEAEKFVEGGIGALDPFALTGDVKEVGEFGIEAVDEAVSGNAAGFSEKATATGVERAEDTAFTAVTEPTRFAGSLVGGALLTGGAIGAARRIFGPRTGKAVSTAIQPGEELAISVGRRVPAAKGVATKVPGVKGSQINAEVKRIMKDESGRLNLAGPSRAGKSTQGTEKEVTKISGSDLDPMGSRSDITRGGRFPEGPSRVSRTPERLQQPEDIPSPGKPTSLGFRTAETEMDLGGQINKDLREVDQGVQGSDAGGTVDLDRIVPVARVEATSPVDEPGTIVDKTTGEVTRPFDTVAGDAPSVGEPDLTFDQELSEFKSDLAQAGVTGVETRGKAEPTTTVDTDIMSDVDNDVVSGTDTRQDTRQDTTQKSDPRTEPKNEPPRTEPRARMRREPRVEVPFEPRIDPRREIPLDLGEKDDSKKRRLRFDFGFFEKEFTNPVATPEDILSGKATDVDLDIDLDGLDEGL